MNPVNRASTGSKEVRCLHDQSDLSALLDGELAGSAVREVMDRILHCPSCGEFYAEARRLEGLLAVAGELAGATPPEDFWSRIESASDASPVDHKVATEVRWLQPKFVGLLAAAAFLVAFTFAVSQFAFQRSPDSLALSVRETAPLDPDTAAMTDERFVELASELLQADPRYLNEMSSLMRQLESERYAEKTTSESRRTSEGAFPVSDGFDSLESGDDSGVSVQLW